MAPFSKPETVLKQAEGLVSVGQTHTALQSLTEMFSSKRFRTTPLSSLEPIVLRFIELCIELRKGRTAKEGLMQYKNIAQNTSVGSIEVVVTRFIALSDAKVREAQEKAAASGVEVDDLEASETPESILLGAVSGDQSKDRTDRALVTPWLKFLWEAYRTCLETLKNNARLEGVYQSVAQGAFKFCLTYGRKIEFKRLCETLRLHLSNVAKYSHQPHSINLSDPDTLQHHLDTRFAQLNASVELELWQEAFRSVEDVHNLLTLAKRPPKAAVMANYYEKLTKIFLMSGNALFHAAAWGRYYSVVLSMGGKTDEEMARLAGQVMVSALAVPVGLPETENTRLTSLLGLSRTPTRAGLIKDALSRNVLGPSPPEVKSLYSFLEVTFDPLGLCKNIAPLFKSLNDSPAYSSYLPLLHRALLSRLLSHLSQVYSSISLTNLFALTAPLKDLPIPGAAEFYDEIGVQAYVIRCARQNEIGVRVTLDHKEGAIHFLDSGFATSEDDVVTSTNEGVQSSTGDLVKKRLSTLAEVLHNSLSYLSLVSSEVVGVEAAPKDKEELRKAANKERSSLSIALLLSARRRELISELHLRSERAAQSALTQNKLKLAQEKEKQEREEAKKREAERREREREEIRELEKRKYAKGLVESGVVKGDVEQLATMDTSSLLSLQLQSLEKEKTSHLSKLRLISKKVDHTERAYRIAELPLLESDYNNQQKEDEKLWRKSQNDAREAAKRQYEEDVDAKQRLGKIKAEADKFREQLLQKRQAAYEKKLEVARKKIEEEKSKRLAAHNAKLAEEKRRREEEEARIREEEERRRREEEERLRREEEERQAEEARRAEAERAKKEEEEKLAAARRQKEAEREKLNEQARLQAQREAEAEARYKARTQERERERQERLRPSSIGRGLNNGSSAEPTVWRRSTTTTTPSNSVPPTPTRSSLSNTATATPPRSESPAPGAGPGKYKPGAFGAGGGWRAREEARRAGTAVGADTPVRSNSPAPAPAAPAREKEEAKVDDDGFTTVAKGGVWRPKRGRA